LLHLHLSDTEIADRLAAKAALPPITDRGYVQLYIKHVQGANLGADLDFLRGGSGSQVTKDSH